MKQKIKTRDKKLSDYSTTRKMRDIIKGDAFLVTIDRERICAKCGYSKHVEICHIKAVKDFDKESTVGQVNHPDNLILLCPNCHWELDHPEDSKKVCPICKTGKYAKHDVCNTCKLNVLEAGTSPKRKSVNYVPYTDIKIPDREVLLQQLENDTKAGVARQYGVSDSTIRLWAEFHNIKTKTLSECNKLRGRMRQMPMPPLEDLISHRKDKSFAKIGKVYNVSSTTIRKWFKRYGINPTDISNQYDFTL